MDIINRTVSKNKTAVVCGCKSVTFGELDEQAEKISGALIAEGAAPGMFVPIILSRSTASAAAMLGALRSGAAFCFIDLAYPDKRKQFMTENLGARIVIDEAWMNRTLNAPVAESAKTKSKAKETDPALVVYTSGSTGKPKGVVISRRVAREKLKPPFDLNEEDVFLNVSSLSFVAGSLYLMTSLHIGMTAHLAGPELLADLNNLARYIKDNAVSTAFMTPWMAAAFLQDHDGLLRMIVMASEKARRAPCGKTTLYNFYGLSETFGGVLLLKVSKPYESDVPNGKTIPGYEVELAEDGEICVSGLLADGYLNLPETTAEKFITKNGKIWLRTGDIGGVDEDGNYICRERKDWMVKVRGFRVELGEVEQAIIRLAGAKEALAKPFSGASGETALIAVYTADGPLTPNEVRAAIKRAVPDYMVPAFIERVEKIPRNVNGKTDRNAIKTPDLDRYLVDYAPPRNDAERALCGAFEKALDIRRVGIDDDWINLGGDSLKATALLTSLPAEIRVSTADLAAYRTPRALAEKAGGVEGGINLPLAEERDEWPVTPNEAMHLEMETHVPNNYAGHYNGALILRGNLDTERLEKALRRVFETHRLFRSVFHKQEKTWLRRVADIPKDILEKAECREEDLQAEIAKRATAFNLETGPLVRWTLFTLTGKTNQYALYHSMHHVLMDGLGLGILNDEISRYYQ
jgi:acyl-coenzyme A synthetase/AMP-(fatty) acid ligase